MKNVLKKLSDAVDALFMPSLVVNVIISLVIRNWAAAMGFFIAAMLLWDNKDLMKGKTNEVD